MRRKLSRHAAILASSRRAHDVGMLVITWCGVLALFGLGVGGSRRKRFAGVLLGVALLILGATRLRRAPALVKESP